jgi:hypothetical protein
MITPEDRVRMLDVIGIGDKACAEIGVFDGSFARLILERNPKSLLLIDPWLHQESRVYPDDDWANLSTEQFELLYQDVKSRLGSDPRVAIARDFSYHYAKNVPYESIDFVYIDAVHTFEGCYCDALIWYQKLKHGGWLCGHDFTGKFLGVRYAVEAFSKLSGEKMSLLTMEQHASWGIQKT